ncbi:MAG: amidohydrolase family protein [Chloroflexi bacterium]|nr:amidohydrolase family protein [Chloroflexota bacterium]
MADILIERATVITMDPARRVIEDGAVAIEGNRIVAVGQTADVRAAHAATKTIDGRRRIVLPGLVDLYAHSGAAMHRSIGEAIDGAAWRNLVDDIAFRYTSPRWWYVESQVHALERLRFGCTMMLSRAGVATPRLDHPRYTAETQRAYEDLGIRARLIVGPPRPPWPKTCVDFLNEERIERQVSLEEVMESCDAVLAHAGVNPSPLIDFSVGGTRFMNPNPQDPMYDPEQAKYSRPQAVALRALMDKYDLGFWCAAYGNAIEYAYDDNLGLLGPRTILSHVSGISQRSIDILAETDTRVGHHPRARRLFEYGEPCPVVELIEAGVIVGLGSDAPQMDRNCDPFLDMKMAISLQRHRTHSDHTLPPGKVLEMATIDGYRALHLDRELGSVEVGKKADLVVVDAFKPHLSPLTMPVHQLVYYATGADVEHVFVDGQQVIESGRPTRIDQAALLEETYVEMERLMSFPELGLRKLTGMPERFWGHASL